MKDNEKYEMLWGYTEQEVIKKRNDFLGKLKIQNIIAITKPIYTWADTDQMYLVTIIYGEE